MYMRPGAVPKLEKGKLIDTVNGFVAYWNWMATFVHNLSKAKGEGIEIDLTVPDKPKLKAVYV